jgi:hypothetical protein
MHVDDETYLLSIAVSWKICCWKICCFVRHGVMDGEARFRGARKRRRTGGWTSIRKGIRRRKRQVTKQKKVRFFWW